MRTEFAEAVHAPANLIDGRLGFVAHAEIQREPWGDPPVVLEISGPVLDPFADRRSDACIQIPDMTKQEVGKPNTGVDVATAPLRPFPRVLAPRVPVARRLRPSEFVALEGRVLTPVLERVVACDPSEIGLVVKVGERSDPLRIASSDASHGNAAVEIEARKRFPALLKTGHAEQFGVVRLAAITSE